MGPSVFLGTCAAPAEPRRRRSGLATRATGVRRVGRTRSASPVMSATAASDAARRPVPVAPGLRGIRRVGVVPRSAAALTSRGKGAAARRQRSARDRYAPQPGRPVRGRAGRRPRGGGPPRARAPNDTGVRGEGDGPGLEGLGRHVGRTLVDRGEAAPHGGTHPRIEAQLHVGERIKQAAPVGDRLGGVATVGAMPHDTGRRQRPLRVVERAGDHELPEGPGDGGALGRGIQTETTPDGRRDTVVDDGERHGGEHAAVEAAQRQTEIGVGPQSPHLGRRIDGCRRHKARPPAPQRVVDHDRVPGRVERRDGVRSGAEPAQKRGMGERFVGTRVGGAGYGEGVRHPSLRRSRRVVAASAHPEARSVVIVGGEGEAGQGALRGVDPAECADPQHRIALGDELPRCGPTRGELTVIRRPPVPAHHGVDERVVDPLGEVDDHRVRVDTRCRGQGDLQMVERRREGRWMPQPHGAGDELTHAAGGRG